MGELAQVARAVDRLKQLILDARPLLLGYHVCCHAVLLDEFMVEDLVTIGALCWVDLEQ